ncbi:MAG TPA: PQQ-binding-like beta-propeller repeat protein [Pirellulaceae bacterium]|nr:PQQ-binding-like beta-propeller repeat protein [Pirellulaceae bacterium]
MAIRFVGLLNVAALCLLGVVAGLEGAETPATPAAVGQWPQHLGPDRNGVSRETGLIDKWPAGGPREVWRMKGGAGMSGLAISRGRVLTLVQKQGQQFLVALNADTGQPIWETAIASEYRNQMGNGPRATPTIAGERAFAYTGEGILAAVNFGDGTLIWSHDLPKELGGEPADYGMACSPLVVGERVIVQVGAPQAAVAALDGASGKLVWKAGDDPAGYSSPALLRVSGQEQVVSFTGGSVMGLAPDKGAVLWRHPYETDFACNIATPLSIKGNVFVSAGENHGSVLVGVQPDGGFAVKELWSSQGGGSVLRCEWQTPVLLDGYLYGFDNVGSAGPVTHLTCIEAGTGKRMWQQLRFGKGNLIAAEGKLLISTMKGELVVARATPEKYEEIGRGVVIGTTRQAPALAGGLLYLRDDKEIVCLDIRQK